MYPERYRKGNTITWFACTSTTTELEVVQNFLPDDKECTIFTINGVFSGRSMSGSNTSSSSLNAEKVPGTRFRVVSVVHIKQVTMVQLQ